MEFLSTREAERQYAATISDVKEIVKERMEVGFFPWLLRGFSKYYNVDDQFALPVFFVTEGDLGHTIPVTEWIGFVDTRLKLPDDIEIPSPHEFDYRHNLLEDAEGLLNSQMKNEEQIVVEWKGSFDRLGLYYGFKSSFRCIFIRIEKIMKEVKLLSSPSGVASVVMHELSHALMDPGCFPDFKFVRPASEKVAETIDYFLEEALANLIAYHSMRHWHITKAAVRDIAEFMKGQPKPYALGIKMGLVNSTKYSSPNFVIKSYVLKWFMAKSDKESLAIDDYRGWWVMVNKAGPFTDTELREQYKMLFS